MIRFFKELYLTAYVLLYRIPGGTTYVKTTQAATIIMLIEWLMLAEIGSCIAILSGTRFLIFSSKLLMLISGLALYYPNYRILVIRGHGIKFEREFNNLKKSRRILLVVSCAVLLLATIAFWIGEETGLPAAQTSGASVLQLSPEAQAAFNSGVYGPMQTESAAWAAGATGGTAPVFIGTGAGRTFWNYEFPQLMNNVNNGTLNSITFHF